ATIAPRADQQALQLYPRRSGQVRCWKLSFNGHPSFICCGKIGVDLSIT
ncbi:hypothetical protein Tco_1477906, partial [Tanacetum coccineum]